MVSLSIVIPAYNEETRLPPTLDAVLAYLAAREWSFSEVVVVDDGSSDGTASLVERYGREHPSVRLVCNPGNRGKGYAVRHGMIEAHGDWRLFSDADLSAPIADLDALLSASAKYEAEVAVGSRALDRSLVSVHQSIFRELAGRFFNVVMRLCLRLPYRDTQCGFKLFSARAAREIFRRQQLDGFGFDVEALFLARKLGFRAIEVPVHWKNVEGSKVTLANGLSAFLDLARVRWNHVRGRYEFPG